MSFRFPKVLFAATLVSAFSLGDAARAAEPAPEPVDLPEVELDAPDSEPPIVEIDTPEPEPVDIPFAPPPDEEESTLPPPVSEPAPVAPSRARDVARQRDSERDYPDNQAAPRVAPPAPQPPMAAPSAEQRRLRQPVRELRGRDALGRQAPNSATAPQSRRSGQLMDRILERLEDVERDPVEAQRRIEQLLDRLDELDIGLEREGDRLRPLPPRQSSRSPVIPAPDFHQGRALGVVLDTRTPGELRILEVSRNSRGEQSGLLVGDEILSINGHRVSTREAVIDQLQRADITHPVELLILRDSLPEYVYIYYYDRPAAAAVRAEETLPAPGLEAPPEPEAEALPETVPPVPEF